MPAGIGCRTRHRPLGQVRIVQGRNTRPEPATAADAGNAGLRQDEKSRLALFARPGRRGDCVASGFRDIRLSFELVAAAGLVGMNGDSGRFRHVGCFANVTSLLPGLW